MKNNNMSAQEENSKLTELIAKLRDVFPFPKEKDWDEGYDHNKTDGWHLAGIVNDPIMCLEIMIGVCDGMKADARNDQALDLHDVMDAVCEHNYIKTHAGYKTCRKCGDFTEIKKQTEP